MVRYEKSWADIALQNRMVIPHLHQPHNSETVTDVCCCLFVSWELHDDDDDDDDVCWGCTQPSSGYHPPLKQNQ